MLLALDLGMTAAARRTSTPRLEPARDLFDPPTTFVPPKEFTNYLKERKSPPAVAPAPAPAPAAVPPPELELSAPTGSGRNFAAALERVQDGDHLVIRERGEHGHHTYRAFERTDVFFHEVTIDELTWGRIDTRRLRDLDPYGYEVVQRTLANSAEAHEVIRRLCPEARRTAGENVPQSGIYDGPGYVLVTCDPETRYRAARAMEVPA